MSDGQSFALVQICGVLCKSVVFWDFSIITFVNDHSRMMRLYLLKERSEFSYVLKVFS